MTLLPLFRWSSATYGHSMSKLPAVSIACLIAAALSLFGVVNLPYGYYMFLRLAVCVTAIAAGLVLVQRRDSKFALMAWALALLYNPVFRVALDKDTWRLVNLVTAVVLVMAALRLARMGTAPEAPQASAHDDR
jgi:hypothetical protein